MKLHILIPLFLFFSIKSFCQWEEKNIQTISSITGVHFLTDDIGFVVGGKQIFQTANGGNNWEVSFDGIGLLLFESVFAAGQNIVVAVGKDFDTGKSLIIRTSDNGDNWEVIPMTTTSFLNSVFFVNNNVGYCSGGGGTILKTIDGGKNWQEKISGTSINLQSIYFTNEMVGIAVGGSLFNSIIIKTEDGGENWVEVLSPSNNNLQSAYFINDQIGFVVGWNGEIIKTEDCGSSWSIQNSVDMSGNLEVVFTDENTGYIVGGQQNDALILKTINGGLEWKEVGPDLAEGLISIYFPSFSTGYAVGANGTVLKTTSGGVSSNREIKPATIVNAYPNPCNDFLMVESMKGKNIGLIKLYDAAGKLLLSKNINASKTKLEFSNYGAHNYYLLIDMNENKTINKIVKI